MKPVDVRSLDDVELALVLPEARRLRNEHQRLGARFQREVTWMEREVKRRNRSKKEVQE